MHVAEENPPSKPDTVQSLREENKFLRRQVEKLAEENAELLKKLATLHVGKSRQLTN
jgi:hypothetical protein